MQRLPLPDFISADIAVWQLALDLDAQPALEDAQLLSDDERARAQRLRRPDDRLRAIAGRAALRRLLALAVDVNPRSLRFGYGAHGKPLLQSHSGPAFNVAHSGACVMIAIGVGTVSAIGVDVERRDDAIDVEALASYALTPSERSALAADGNTSAAFYSYWNAKEAALKALGVGVAEYLQRLSVRRCATAGLRVRHDLTHWPQLQVCALPAPPHYSAALAWHIKD